ncbi:hypothetical protein [Cytobacillus gottheilii]|uniref:hypothetical protein n=1 Tax=Cytobacillus gottheilii TaxID=859144 RepID=UPI002493E195|nr:hypothetical protein [Cytobacillus gottheilii]
MSMNLQEFSLIPVDYREKDPRTLPFLYPQSLNIVAYAKKMQEFSYYQALEVAETLAKMQGFVLLPWSCIHWERAKNLGHDRKIKIGRKSFFLLKTDEMTKTEKRKLESLISEMKTG